MTKKVEVACKDCGNKHVLKVPADTQDVPPRFTLCYPCWVKRGNKYE